MNKFAIVALFACVAVAGAQLVDDTFDSESQAVSVLPTDDEEVANLPEDQMKFSQYCKDSREWVLASIRTSSNRLASNVFQMLFQSAEALGRDTISTIDNASDRLATQLRNPDAEIAPAEDVVEEILKEAQEKIKAGESQPKAFLTGFKATIAAVSKNVSNFVESRIKALSEMANPALLWKSITDVCEAAEAYEKELKSQFNAIKDPSDKVQYEDVKCVTTRRVSRIEGLCKFAAAAKPTIPKLFAMNKRA